MLNDLVLAAIWPSDLLSKFSFYSLLAHVKLFWTFGAEEFLGGSILYFNSFVFFRLCSEYFWEVVDISNLARNSFRIRLLLEAELELIEWKISNFLIVEEFLLTEFSLELREVWAIGFSSSDGMNNKFVHFSFLPVRYPRLTPLLVESSFIEYSLAEKNSWFYVSHLF